MGSYKTYEEFIAEHPTGTAGDAYLVDGELYIWDEATGSWQRMGSLVGPTGAAGAAILDSYETYEEFITEHPIGTEGDAYLVDGQMYVWTDEMETWQDMGSLIGPTGPTGAAGVTILDSYETYEEFIAEHPTGTEGDAYLVDGQMYVWTDETETWQNMGSLIGPTGAAGAAILDSYETYAEFIAEHPTGTGGDAYLVDGSLYVWMDETETWENMGSLIGPTGGDVIIGLK